MIKGQPFSVNTTSNPSFTLDASKIGLVTFADCVVANNGPGAVGVWPSGSASGPAIEVIGANQRKYIALGNVQTITCAFLPAINATLRAEIAFQLYAALTASDDYSLVGTSDFRAGNTIAISTAIILPTGSGFLTASDAGLDKIRGIYIPAQPNPPEIYIVNLNDPSLQSYPLLNNPGSSISVSVDQIEYVNLIQTNIRSAFFISDDPIDAGAAGGGTYG